MTKNHPESFYIQDGVTKAKMFGEPILVDEVSTSLTYVGYAEINIDTLVSDSTLLIKKIETNGGLISISFAYGVWDNRASLTYIGY